VFNVGAIPRSIFVLSMVYMVPKEFTGEEIIPFLSKPETGFTLVCHVLGGAVSFMGI